MQSFENLLSSFQNFPPNHLNAQGIKTKLIARKHFSLQLKYFTDPSRFADKLK